MKNLLIGLWNIFSILLIIILKILCCLLYIPFQLFQITFSLIGGYITAIGCLLAGIIFLLGIFALFTLEMGTAEVVMYFVLIMVFAAIPILLTYFFDVISYVINNSLDYLIKTLHITSWTIRPMEKIATKEKSS